MLVPFLEPEGLALGAERARGRLDGAGALRVAPRNRQRARRRHGSGVSPAMSVPALVGVSVLECRHRAAGIRGREGGQRESPPGPGRLGRWAPPLGLTSFGARRLLPAPPLVLPASIEHDSQKVRARPCDLAQGLEGEGASGAHDEQIQGDLGRGGRPPRATGVSEGRRDGSLNLRRQHRNGLPHGSRGCDGVTPISAELDHEEKAPGCEESPALRQGAVPGRPDWTSRAGARR